jgi:hypothetical protein
LDCITFARSVLGVPDHLAGPSQHSDKLAAYLRDVHCAEDCGLEKGEYASLANWALHDLDRQPRGDFRNGRDLRIHAKVWSQHG